MKNFNNQLITDLILSEHKNLQDARVCVQIYWQSLTMHIFRARHNREEAANDIDSYLRNPFNGVYRSLFELQRVSFSFHKGIADDNYRTITYYTVSCCHPLYILLHVKKMYCYKGVIMIFHTYRYQ